MTSPYIHERRRLMDTAKKVKFAQLVRESHSLEEAAEWGDVSIRTVQRERRRDEDFDHEVRLAQQASPDPLRLMENAARTHWGAAAWLLERTRPEEYARKPANTARDFQVEAALGMLLEAALAATAPAERLAFYEKVQPTCNQALQYCFPQLGPGGNLKKSKLPQTPLANEVSNEALKANIAAHQQRAQAVAAAGERVSEWFTVPSPYDELSPKTSKATPNEPVGWVLAPTLRKCRRKRVTRHQARRLQPSRNPRERSTTTSPSTSTSTSTTSPPPSASSSRSSKTSSGTSVSAITLRSSDAKNAKPRSKRRPRKNAPTTADEETRRRPSYEITSNQQ